MGTIVQFSAAAAPRASRADDGSPRGQVVILPVIRIERYDEQPNGDGGPEEGAKSRRRRRRARS